MLIGLAKFAVLSGLILFLAWLAAGLAYAVLDLVGYEIVKSERRG